MVLNDIGAGLCTLTMALLLMANRLDVWHIYIAMANSSAYNAFQWPAGSAATTLLVAKEHLGRAGGMSQSGETAAASAMGSRTRSRARRRVPMPADSRTPFAVEGGACEGLTRADPGPHSCPCG